MTMHALLRCAIMAMLPMLLCAAERTVYEENFDARADGTTLDQIGWRIRDPGNTCRFVVADKKLKVTCRFAKELRGGGAEIDIPLVRRGELSFDLLNDHDRQGIGLCLDVYNITVFWHEYCCDWRRYFPEPTARRMPMYNVEPVGHRRLSPVAKRTWNHYRILFDKDQDRVEYFLNDMNDPVFIDGGAAVWGRSEYLGGTLRIGNWGVTEDSFDYQIDNLKLVSRDEDGPGAAEARDQVVVFNGLSSERYAVVESLVAGGVKAERIHQYTLNNHGGALEEKNLFAADKLPGMQTTGRAATIVLTDFPSGPDEILPQCVLEDIARNVRQGARLVILGGLCSYAKGGYANGPLAACIPVRMSTCWDVQPNEPPLPIEPAGPTLFPQLDWKAKPVVSYQHRLEPTPGSSVLLAAGGRPLLVSGRYGQGEVLAFLGTTCGDPSGTAFWRWADWPKLVQALASPGARAGGVEGAPKP